MATQPRDLKQYKGMLDDKERDNCHEEAIEDPRCTPRANWWQRNRIKSRRKKLYDMITKNKEYKDQVVLLAAQVQSMKEKVKHFSPTKLVMLWLDKLNQ